MRSSPPPAGWPPERRRAGARLRLRRMQRRDVAAVAALDAAAIVVNHAFVPLVSAARVDRGFARRTWAGRLRLHEQPTFVAEERGRLLGTVSVDLIRARNRHMAIRRWAYVHSLFVRPEARRRGVARRLMRHALAWARRRGAGGAELGMAAANRGARRLYESLGFEVQEVTMARRLSQSRP
jgi:GNAT superfamily N-acetyltransferase